MKKTLVASYIDGLRDETHGVSYENIMRCFLPEMVTALVLYSLVVLVDARFIAYLKSTELYATIGVTNTLMHFLTKIAEGLSVGTMVLCGYFHGKKDTESVQCAAISALMIAACLALVVWVGLYFYAETIYRMLGTPEKIITFGVPFLRMRSFAVVLMFIFFAISGFLRGIKQNYIPTRCLVFGSCIFIICDYVLIFGKCGLPALCLQGSAVASVIQYSVMVSTAIIAIIRDNALRARWKSWYRSWSWSFARRICVLSWPVMCDKSVLAIAKMLLVRAIAPMGALALGSFGAIKDLEMLAFVPAVAFAQVTTILVSNQWGAGDVEGIKYTVKRTLLLAVGMVLAILAFCSWHVWSIISLFDTQHAFTDFAARAFRMISCLAVFDVVQVILSSALRGVAQMRVVLWVRVITLCLFAIPVAYGASQIAFQPNFDTFIAIYSSFYIGNGLMALCYIYWFRSDRWREVTW
jgi:putative MATE family efflux protein